MTIIFTKDKEWLDKWDDYVTQAPRASHLLLSDWLKSYQSYGFDYDVGIVLDNDAIIGGCGVIIPKVLFFKFYIIPHGPIVDKGYESHLDKLLQQIDARATQLNCCYVQFSLPISSNSKIKDYVFDPQEIMLLQNNFTKGKLFSYVYCSYGLNWVDFGDSKNAEAYLEQLTPKVRRNIRLPYNKGAVAGFETHEAAINKGYKVIEANAELGHYSVRSFHDFKYTILPLIKNKRAYFINITFEDRIKASCFVIRAGNYLTNISGGALRNKPDIKLGYMLQ